MQARLGSTLQRVCHSRDVQAAFHLLVVAAGLLLGLWTWSAQAGGILDDACAQRCQQVYGADVTGRQLHWGSGQCRCTQAGQALGRIERTFPPERVPLGSEVCGTDGKTYPNEETAHQVTTVLHGGFCGQCSNAQDIEVYRRTRSSLTETATQSAARYVLWGRPAAAQHFSSVGFTPGCETCWLDNMACTYAHCGSICIKARLLKTPNTIQGVLNPCLACDEQHCGPTFIRCAGVNRRRAGILSDIQRPNDEVWVQPQ